MMPVYTIGEMLLMISPETELAKPANVFLT